MPRSRHPTLALLLALPACSDVSDYSVHAPSVLGNDCGRVPIQEYAAGPEECVKLTDTNGRTLFKLTTSESCGGPPCVVLQPGESGYVLEKIKPGVKAEWTVERGACDQIEQCCGVYEPCGGYCCW